MAIYALEASVKISGNCNVGMQPGCQCPEADLERTTFEGFYKAVKLDGISSLFNSRIKQCGFNNNLVGIELESSHNTSITRNNFEVGNCDIALYPPIRAVCGIKVLSSTGYRVEENKITLATNINYDNNAGISVQNCDMDNNQIYKNKITDVKYAIASNGVNRAINGFTGVQFLCNEFYNSQNRDIDVAKDFEHPGGYDGIRDQQGVLEESAANLFTVDHAGFEYHLTNITDHSYTYFFNANADPNLEPTLITSYVYPIDVEILPSGTTYVAANSCPSHLGEIHYPLDINKENELISSFNSSKTAYWNIYYNYLQEIDNGNTPAMLQQIQGTWSQEAWDMRDGIIAEAPFVSEDALREAASTGVLPDAMLLEICIANPDATKNRDFLDFLANDIPNPLPEYMIDMIEANWDTRTARTTFETELAEHGAKMDYYYGILLANEKLKEERDTAAILSYYAQRDNLSDRYAHADYLVSTGDIAQAQNIISQIPVDFKLSDKQYNDNLNYTDFLDLMNLHLTRDSSMFLFTESEIDDLELIANAGSGSASYKAQSLLCFAYGICKDYPVVVADSLQPKSLHIAGNPQDVLNEFYYKINVSPNPASSHTTFEWDFPLLEESVNLSITDLSGKPVEMYIISTKQGQFLWDTRKIKNGVYLYSVISNDKVMSNGKIVIAK